MAKNLKTFVISKTQIATLRAMLVANNEAAEADKLSGSDLALRWKAINLPEIGSKTQKEAFTKQYPYFVGFDLQSIKPEPKPQNTTEAGSAEIAAGESGATEMTATETTPKAKGKNKKEAEVAPEPTEQIA